MASYREIVEFHFAKAKSRKSAYFASKNNVRDTVVDIDNCLGGFENDSATHGTIVMSQMLENTEYELLILSERMGTQVHNIQRWLNWSAKNPSALAKILVQSSADGPVKLDGTFTDCDYVKSIVPQLLIAERDNIEIRCHPYCGISNMAISDRTATRIEHKPREMKAKIRPFDPYVATKASNKFYLYWDHPSTSPVTLVN